ncbi:MAG: RagB/SusD family nutrient uptake outer membrane protein [Chitinophagaceae bacterium]|nr:MAG: RagB/SusD family nutrient uptake outer membrane protein [Chitinophagaceae bacterium]
MKKVFVLIALIIPGITGCKKFLSTTPQDFLQPGNYYQTADQAMLALNSGYELLLNSNWWGGTFNTRALMCGDDVYMTISPYPADFTSNYTDPLLTSTWNVVYTAIERMNVLLANLNNGKYDQQKKDIIKGEALFLRAYCYFFLVDQWGPVPLRIEPTSGPKDKNLACSPIADVYAQIIKDMTEADSLVPPATTSGYGGNGYPAKTTVEAMLARVYLTMAGHPLMDASKYRDAEAWGMKVINSGLHSLDPSYSQMFIDLIQGNPDKRSILWAVDAQYIPGYYTYSNEGALDGIAYGPVDSGYGYGYVRCARLYYKTFSLEDQRRDWTICPWRYGTNGAHVNWTSTQLYDRFPGKFRLNYSPFPRLVDKTPVNFPLMRYADVLLMVAEAENAVNGPTQLAYSLINKVRERGWGKMLPGATNPQEADLTPGLDQQQFQDSLEDERWREFGLEGLRKHDLIRWGELGAALQRMQQDVTDQNQPNPGSFYVGNVSRFFKNYQPRDTLFPIPAQELQSNSLATQNAGW